MPFGITISNPDLLAYFNALNGLRLEKNTDTELVLSQVQGNVIIINGAAFTEVAGFDVTSRLLIDSAGVETVAPAAGDFLFMYVGIGPRGFTLYASLSNPAKVNGVYYLSATGVGSSLRFVGMALVTAVTAAADFTDTEQDRLVFSYNNQRARALLAQPAYTDDNANTNLAVFNSATFATVNGGTNDTVRFIRADGPATSLCAAFSLGAATTAVCAVGIGVNFAASSQVPSAAQFANGAALGSSVTVPAVVGPSVDPDTSTWGVYSASLVAMSTAVNVTFRADLARNGAAADPCTTQLTGTVWC